MINKSLYKSPKAENWTGRDDGPDFAVRRWHAHIRPADLTGLPKFSGKNIAILGFASDEGVRRNKGRIGAANGPAAIREACASLPVHFPENIGFWDAGDVFCPGTELENAQENLAEAVKTLVGEGVFPVVFGGGHEISAGHFEGLRRAFPAPARIGIVNFDAHFDLREPEAEIGPSSGTPFWQIAQKSEAENRPFDYFCVGVQKASNTAKLYETAERLGVNSVDASELVFPSPEPVEKLKNFIQSVDYLYITICLDVFPASSAPGVSAPNPVGVLPERLLPFLHLLMASGKAISADIAEMSPAFDSPDRRTARLAARLAFELTEAYGRL